VSAEWATYRTSPGYLLNTQVPAGDDVDARANLLLDARDLEHDRVYGHLPGDPGCTLPPRESYRAAARAQLAAAGQRCRIPGGCETREAQALIERLAPWEFFEHADEDPALAEARRDLAAKVRAGLAVTRG
jgi:hypothetical protein